MSHLTYLRRIVSPYILRKNSQLTFWHERPKVNCNSFGKDLGEYYMTFFDKAGYSGPFDQNGIPLLDYHGKIGKQYNPIAIAQYGLGNYNLHKRNRGNISYEKFIKSANWLLENLETNEYGIKVWNHKFNWEYFQILQAPWYSALAQGQGISLLIRAYIELKEDKYKEAADKAFKSLVTKIEDGGVLFIDEGKNWWLEEYLVNPPSHVLNGFIWALWGVYDYYLITRNEEAYQLYNKGLETIKENLSRFDIGYWSLYDLSENRLKTIASFFYHNLHIVQLQILHKLTGDDVYSLFADKWIKYRGSFLNRMRAFFYKSAFKLIYY